MEKRIEDWKIVPCTGDAICLIGLVDGVITQTSIIAQFRRGEVKTQNTHYILGERNAGMWEIQLQMKRPVQWEKLRQFGVL